MAEARIEYLTRKVATLEAKIDEAARVFEVEGDQVVEVNGYAYRWSRQGRLTVGDYVMIPSSYVDQIKGHNGPKRGRVTALGSTYNGRICQVLGRAEPPEAAP